MNILNKAKEIDTLPATGIRYSVCTLVSRLGEYEEMLQSFIDAGFKEDFCEFIYIDNSKSNKYDAYTGLNHFLNKAQGKYIILCHQDILLKFDNLEVLEEKINEIEKLDKNWAIIGNAGAVDIKNIVLTITESDGAFYQVGNPPKAVKSVDENFILVRKEANLGLSNDLRGFHLYGTDICLQAFGRGYNSYVVKFNLLHKSKGNADEKFYQLRDEFLKKYIKAWHGRYIQTTITKFYISGSSLMNWFFNSRFLMFLSRKYYKRKYRKENKATG